jgi:hypothetical protein
LIGDAVSRRECVTPEHTPIRPEDVPPDGTDATTFAGLDVRKGTVAAFVANAKQFEKLAPGDRRREAVETQQRALAPALRAVGLVDVFAPRSADFAESLARNDAQGG